MCSEKNITNLMLSYHRKKMATEAQKVYLDIRLDYLPGLTKLQLYTIETVHSFLNWSFEYNLNKITYLPQDSKEYKKRITHFTEYQKAYVKLTNVEWFLEKHQKRITPDKFKICRQKLAKFGLIDTWIDYKHASYLFRMNPFTLIDDRVHVYPLWSIISKLSEDEAQEHYLNEKDYVWVDCEVYPKLVEWLENCHKKVSIDEIHNVIKQINRDDKNNIRGGGYFTQGDNSSQNQVSDLKDYVNFETSDYNFRQKQRETCITQGGDRNSTIAGSETHTGGPQTPIKGTRARVKKVDKFKRNNIRKYLMDPRAKKGQKLKITDTKFFCTRSDVHGGADAPPEHVARTSYKNQIYQKNIFKKNICSISDASRQRCSNSRLQKTDIFKERPIGFIWHTDRPKSINMNTQSCPKNKPMDYSRTGINLAYENKFTTESMQKHPIDVIMRENAVEINERDKPIVAHAKTVSNSSRPNHLTDKPISVTTKQQAKANKLTSKIQWSLEQKDDYYRYAREIYCLFYEAYPNYKRYANWSANKETWVGSLIELCEKNPINNQSLDEIVDCLKWMIEDKGQFIAKLPVLQPETFDNKKKYQQLKDSLMFHYKNFKSISGMLNKWKNGLTHYECLDAIYSEWSDYMDEYESTSSNVRFKNEKEYEAAYRRAGIDIHETYNDSDPYEEEWDKQLEKLREERQAKKSKDSVAFS